MTESLWERVIKNNFTYKKGGIKGNLNHTKLFKLLVHILQRKLSVYLAPFLYGTRYTSFGRHFTKVDKLKEVNSTDGLFDLSFSCSLVLYLVYLDLADQ